MLGWPFAADTPAIIFESVDGYKAMGEGTEGVIRGCGTKLLIMVPWEQEFGLMSECQGLTGLETEYELQRLKCK